ncbi:hypothetical protein CA601_31095 [Paraburkholderia hospita]|nr:hypothetical protein CA601_31095 [Paraburkholderia hospita]
MIGLPVINHSLMKRRVAHGLDDANHSDSYKRFANCRWTAVILAAVDAAPARIRLARMMMVLRMNRRCGIGSSVRQE